MNSTRQAIQPGFWRRILVDVQPGAVRTALEDDAHCFELELAHQFGRVTKVTAQTIRIPWSACPSAVQLLSNEIVGAPLEHVWQRDPSRHCTHLLDLAILAAALSSQNGRTRYDLHVADSVDANRSALLFADGELRLQWDLSGTTILGAEATPGRDLRDFGQWKGDLSASELLHTKMLRRAVMVSGVRRQPARPARASDRGPARLGACFTYQARVAPHAARTEHALVDFSTSGTTPLADHDFSRSTGI